MDLFVHIYHLPYLSFAQLYEIFFFQFIFICLVLVVCLVFGFIYWGRDNNIKNISFVSASYMSNNCKSSSIISNILYTDLINEYTEV